MNFISETVVYILSIPVMFAWILVVGVVGMVVVGVVMSIFSKFNN